MTCQGYNIKIVEGNAFALVLPLKRRTFVSEQPIDEDIDILSLEDVVVKIGNVIYANTLEEDGVHVLMPATLSRGTYQIELTAVYQGSAIRAAYFEAFTIVAWNYQSDAQQYVQGSPIVLDAAYVIGGTLTDAELEQLKQEFREKNAQLDQAIEDAEAAKREWEQKAADLDGVAQEETSQQILTAVANIDFSSLAKEATLGTPQDGQPSTIFAAIAAIKDSGINLIVERMRAAGVDIAEDASVTDVYNKLGEYFPLVAAGSEFVSGYTNYNFGDTLLNASRIRIINAPNITSLARQGVTEGSFRSLGFTNLREAYFENVTYAYVRGLFESLTNLRIVYMPKCTAFENSTFYNTGIEILNILSLNAFAYQPFGYSAKIIDLTIGKNFNSSINMQNAAYNPSQAYRTDTSSLCYDSDLERYGQLFSRNWDKWKWCVINHFAANVPDRTGLTAYTITFGSTVLSHFDAEMIAAFTDKNWTLA